MKNKLHPFRKKWGQNFIADTNLLDRIVRTLELDKNNSLYRDFNLHYLNN